MDPLPTRDKLLQAAAQVFSQHGFASAAMELVRQQAGVSNGSLYHHFPTKAQLADALYAWTLRDFHAAQLAPIRGRASAQNGVKGMVRAYVDWVCANPERARLLHDLKRSGDLAGGSGEWQQANAETLGVLREWIERQMAAGEMRTMPLSVWMAVVFGPAMSLTGAWVREPQPAVAPKVRSALEHAAWMAVAP